MVFDWAPTKPGPSEIPRVINFPQARVGVKRSGMRDDLPVTHNPGCDTSRFLQRFPNIVHLHLDLPILLKLLAPPHTLEKLTLEAFPVKRAGTPHAGPVEDVGWIQHCGSYTTRGHAVA